MAGGVLSHVSPIEEEAEKLAMDIERSESGRILSSDNIHHIPGSFPMSRRQSRRSLTRNGDDLSYDGGNNSTAEDPVGSTAVTRPPLRRDRVSWLFRGTMKDERE